MSRPDRELPVSVITPPAAWPGLDLRELWQFRSLCLVLAHRLLKVRYRQTVIGVGWAVGQPLMLMVVFAVFFGALARLETQGVPYAVFYFTGLAVWQIVTKVVSEGTVSVTGQATLIDRVYFPRVYLVVAGAIATFVDLVFNLVALGVLLLISGFPMPSPSIVFVLLPLIVLAYAVSLGVAFFLCALNVAYRDVSVILPVLVQLWFFGSPVIYPVTIVPQEWQLVYYLNPIALVITDLRSLVVGTPPAPPAAWPVSTAVAVLALLGGYLFFRKRQATFADIV